MVGTRVAKVVRCPLTVAVVVIKTLVYADVEVGDKLEGTAFPVACWWSVGWWPDMELGTPVSV